MPDTPDTPHLAVDAPPVMFIHGLWLAASSWDPWRTRFGAAGFSTLAPTWPGEAPSITDTREHADDQAGYGIDEVTAHFAEAIAPLGRKPIVVGHSFGGPRRAETAGRRRSPRPPWRSTPPRSRA